MIFKLWKKEIDSYYSSPLAYVLIGLFSLITGVIFFNLLMSYNDGIRAISPEMAQQISFVDEVVMRLFANINFIFLFFIPLITMKLFSEEMKQETIQLLWLAPIKIWQIITSKALAAFTLILSMLLLTGVYPLVIWGVGIRDFSILGAAYLSIILNSLCYISLGLFCSSLTSNQIIAALLSILSIMGFWMITWGGHLISNYLVAEIFTYVGMTSHFERILRGQLGTHDIIYYLSFSIVFLLLTVKSLSRRSWI